MQIVERGRRWNQLVLKSICNCTLVGFLAVSGCSPQTHAQDLAPQAIEELKKANSLLENASDSFSDEKYKAAIEAASECGEILLELCKDKTATRVISMPRMLQATGEILYRSGDSKKSLPCFDKVVQLEPLRAPLNWQRGIALCSRGDFERGAKQFETHHKVNPDDVENSAWYFLCIAKTKGIEAARKTVIPSRGDGREPMMSVLALLKEEIKPDEVMEAAIDNTSEGPSRRRAKFYADLYIGLYYDSLDKKDEAAKYLKRSLTYGDAGYMVDVARVYLNDRFPSVKEKKN